MGRIPATVMGLLCVCGLIAACGGGSGAPQTEAQRIRSAAQQVAASHNNVDGWSVKTIDGFLTECFNYAAGPPQSRFEDTRTATLGYDQAQGGCGCALALAEADLDQGPIPPGYFEPGGAGASAENAAADFVKCYG
jgi:hypothetical protein